MSDGADGAPRIDLPAPGGLLAAHGLRAKRGWGQNFLRDRSVLRRIAECAAPQPGHLVVELGAGLGHLTAELVRRGSQVVAVERDRDLVPILERVFGDAPSVQVLAADAKRIDLHALARGAGRVVVAGNLPYNISTPILFHLLESHDVIARIVTMVQREVAERIVAVPGGKAYGVLAVRFGLHFEARRVFDVEARAFLPPPKVVSTVVELRARSHPLADPGDEVVYARVVKAAFGQRRKTIANALRAGRFLSQPALLDALEAAGIDPSARAETIPIEAFAALSRVLAHTTDP